MWTSVLLRTIIVINIPLAKTQMALLPALVCRVTLVMVQSAWISMNAQMRSTIAHQELRLAKIPKVHLCALASGATLVTESSVGTWMSAWNTPMFAMSTVFARTHKAPTLASALRDSLGMGSSAQILMNAIFPHTIALPQLSAKIPRALLLALAMWDGQEAGWLARMWTSALRRPNLSDASVMTRQSLHPHPATFL